MRGRGIENRVGELILTSHCLLITHNSEREGGEYNQFICHGERGKIGCNIS